MIYAALDMLKWMQKQGLLKNRSKNKQNEDCNRVNGGGNDVSNIDDYDNNNSNNSSDGEIEHINYHSKWLNNVRHSCLLTSKATMMNKGQESESRPDEDKGIKSQQEQDEEEEEEGDWSETLEGGIMYTFMYYLCISSH
jgi:hypothetical protein